MVRRLVSFRRFITTGLVLAVLSVVFSICASAQDSDSPHRGRKYKAPPPTSRVEVTVVRATTGKPIENASVIFHPLVNGRNNGNMELKTNDEGKAVIELLPIGSSVRLQIIAHGFQTYGEDYKVDKDTIGIEVKMKRPAEQYSIYEKSEGKASGDKSADKPKEDAPKDTPPGEATDKQTDPQDKSNDKPNDAPKDEAKPQDSTPPK